MLQARHPVATLVLAHPVHRRLSSAGRASALQAEGRRFDPVSLHHNCIAVLTNDAGWSSPVARRAHNPKAAGSNPAPATNYLRCHTENYNVEPWCRGLTCLPVTQETAGSNPVGSAIITKYGSVAQSVEQRTENPRVGGSIPSRATISDKQ